MDATLMEGLSYSPMALDPIEELSQTVSERNFTCEGIPSNDLSVCPEGLGSGKITQTSSQKQKVPAKRKKKAPTKRQEDWEPVRGRISELYPNNTLSYIMADLKANFGFIANERQFKFQIRKWALKKNIDGAEMRFIAIKQNERENLQPGKRDLRFRIRGELVKSADIKRWKIRTGFVANDSDLIISDTPDAISCQTSPAPNSEPCSPGVLENVLTVSSPGQIENDLLLIGTRLDSGVMAAVRHMETLDQENITPLPSEPELDLEDIEEIMRYDSGLVPAPQSPSFSEFFDLDGNYRGQHAGSDLTDNLPFFHLLEVLVPQRFSRDDASLNPGDRFQQWRSPPPKIPHDREAAGIPLSVRLSFLAALGLLGRTAKSGETRTSQIAVSNFAQLAPSASQNELQSRISRLCDASEDCPLQYLFEVSAFMIANNMLDKWSIVIFLWRIVDENYTDTLISFLETDADSARAFSRNILNGALILGDTDILRGLLLAKVDFKPAINRVIQLKDDEFVIFLLTRVDSKLLFGPSGGWLLWEIADTNRIEIADFLIKSGAHIDFKNPDNRESTPLYRAVENQKVEMVKFLLANGADVNAQSGVRSISTPLAVAVLVGQSNFDILSLLLGAGADTRCYLGEDDLLDYVSKRRSTQDIYQFILKETCLEKHDSPRIGDLLAAAENGEKSFSSLLEQHAISQDRLEKALHNSIEYGWGETVSLTLLGSGIHPDTPSMATTALEVAAHYEKWALCEHLIEAGANINKGNILSNAIWDFDTLELLLDAGADVEVFGPGALVNATEEGKVDAIALLLDRGTPIDATDVDSLNPLQTAAGKGYIEIAQYLIDRGADVNAPAASRSGRTALQSALINAEMELVTFLLEHGADVTAAPAAENGCTALEALFEGYENLDMSKEVFETTFRFLLERGADILRSSSRTSRLLHGFIEDEFFDLLDFALLGGVDPNSMCSSQERRTPLQYAAELSSLEAAKILVGYGALVNHPPAIRGGRTALQAALSTPIANPKIEMVEYLIGIGAEINAPAAPCQGVTAIQGAAISGRIPLVQFLLEKGADVNSRPAVEDGRTAIEGAAEHGRLDMVQFLLNVGAKGDVIGKNGYKKAIELAKEEGHLEIVKLLETAQKGTAAN